MLTKKVACPGCSSPLKLPDPPPEGKVRCPQCKASFVLRSKNGSRPPAKPANGAPRKPAPPPVEDVVDIDASDLVDDEPRSKSPSSKPRKPAPPPDDDVEEFEVAEDIEEVEDEPPAKPAKSKLRKAPPPDEDDDLADEPTRKPKSKKKKRFAKKEPPKNKVPMIIGVVIGALLLVGGAAGGIYWLTSGKTTAVAQNDSSKPKVTIPPIQMGRPGGQQTPPAENPDANTEGTTPPATEPAPGDGGSANASVGEKVFNQNCARCHALTEGTRKRGPSLAGIGREHDADWLANFIKDPKSVRPNIRGMPAFDGRIEESDLRALAEYLASLK